GRKARGVHPRIGVEDEVERHPKQLAVPPERIACADGDLHAAASPLRPERLLEGGSRGGFSLRENNPSPGASPDHSSSGPDRFRKRRRKPPVCYSMGGFRR